MLTIGVQVALSAAALAMIAGCVTRGPFSRRTATRRTGPDEAAGMPIEVPRARRVLRIALLAGAVAVFALGDAGQTWNWPLFQYSAIDIGRPQFAAPLVSAMVMVLIASTALPGAPQTGRRVADLDPRRVRDYLPEGAWLLPGSATLALIAVLVTFPLRFDWVIPDLTVALRGASAYGDVLPSIPLSIPIGLLLLVVAGATLFALRRIAAAPYTLVGRPAVDFALRRRLSRFVVLLASAGFGATAGMSLWRAGQTAVYAAVNVVLIGPIRTVQLGANGFVRMPAGVRFEYAQPAYAIGIAETLVGVLVVLASVLLFFVACRQSRRNPVLTRTPSRPAPAVISG